jgi:hypothetical protein
VNVLSAIVAGPAMTCSRTFRRVEFGKALKKIVSDCGLSHSKQVDLVGLCELMKNSIAINTQVSA